MSKLKKIFQITILATLLFSHSVVFATADYNVLSPLPGTTQGNCTATDGSCKTDLGTYLPGLFNLLIGVGAISAFVIITIYGFQIMTTDSLNAKLNAKSMLENALWGLGLIIFAYVILYTINPNLLNGNLNITTPVVNSTSFPNIADAFSEAAVMRELTLNQPPIGINNECTPGQTGSCTQVGGLTANTISQLEAMAKQCNCALIITGGSELGVHDPNGTHPAGTGVDLALNSQLSSYLGVPNPVAGKTYDVIINGQSAKALYEVAGTKAGNSISTGPHWHIFF